MSSHYTPMTFDNTQASKKRVILITKSRFWDEGAGLWARTREMTRGLSKHTRLTVVYLGPLMQKDRKKIQSLKFPLKLIALGHPEKNSAKYMITQFRRAFNRQLPFDTYIIDKTENSFMLNVIPIGSKKIVDTHDLISNRTESTESFGMIENFPLTEKQEIEILRRYDKVICIQQEEYNKVIHWFDNKKAILSTHPITIVNRPINNTVRRIAVVASAWHANIDGIRNFISNTWPKIRHHNITLDIYGYAAKEFNDVKDSRINLYGFIKDLNQCYSNAEIIINPVRYGAGLKIKTVEALANGIPLVTSREGASGLEHLEEKALIIANTPDQYVMAFERLISDFNLRSALVYAGKEYIKSHMSHDKSFKELVETINQWE